MRIKDIARIEGREAITIKPNAGLSEAIKTLVTNTIGAMPVCDFKGTLLGIISERDILKWIHHNADAIGKAKVKDIMTTNVVVGDPEDDVAEILEKMMERGVRHLPIMTGNRVVGMLSLRDVIEEQCKEYHSQVRYLHDYIAGGYSQS